MISPSATVALQQARNPHWVSSKEAIRLLSCVYSHREDDPMEWEKCQALLEGYSERRHIMGLVQRWESLADVRAIWSPGSDVWGESIRASPSAVAAGIFRYAVANATRFYDRIDADAFNELDKDEYWFGRWRADAPYIDWLPHAFQLACGSIEWERLGAIRHLASESLLMPNLKAKDPTKQRKIMQPNRRQRWAYRLMIPPDSASQLSRTLQHDTD